MRPKRSYYFFAIVFLPILISLQNPNVSEPLHNFSRGLVKPIFMLGSSASDGFRSFQDALSRLWQSFKDQGEYKKRLVELESRLLEYDEMKKENLRLKNLLGFKDSMQGKTIPARIIGWDPSQVRKTLVLDKGVNQGVKKDMAVVVSEGLVGRVLESGPSTARVILILDPESRVSGIANDSRAQGVVAGNGSPTLTMEYMDFDGGAKVDEIVLTSGVGGVFPKGIRIGKIMSLGKDEAGLHLGAKIESYVQFSKLEEVLCLDSLKQS